MKKQKIHREKPYNRCLSCHHKGIRCDGPRTSAMSLERWCEFMRDMKEANGLTNIDIAEKSGVSIKTVERLMAINCDQDIRRETARLIEDAIIGSSNNYPCILAYEDENPRNEQRLNDTLKELERAIEENKDYKAILDKIHDTHAAELASIRSEHREHVDRLRKEIDFLLAENERKARIIEKFVL